MYLKDCPYCGGEPEVVHDKEGWFYIRCKKCWARTNGCATSKDAKDFWNARKPLEEICKNMRRILPFVPDGSAKDELYELVGRVEEKEQTGEWLQFEEQFECSVCGCRLDVEGNTPNFCPHCGARMK